MTDYKSDSVRRFPLMKSVRRYFCDMGIGQSVQQNREIEMVIREDAIKSKTIKRLLLLGAGESGKSTILKQMRIIHANGFTESDMREQHRLIIQNTLQSIAAILRAMEPLGIRFDNKDREYEAGFILKAEDMWIQNGRLSPEEWSFIGNLWADVNVQECYQRSHEYQLGDSAKYFLDNIDRIKSPLYKPTHDDILRIRSTTLGVVELSFKYRNYTLKVIDVGGQRSQRKKWIHCFEGVDSLIFVTALSEYNQTLLEDRRINRMHESLRLFDTVCNSKWFKGVPIILFLNKKDLFAQKLRSFALTLCFQEYQGHQCFDEATKFVEGKFCEKTPNEIFTHKTCATDTQNVEFVMEATFSMILDSNMGDLGLV